MITQTFNMDIVNSILCEPDIWSKVAPEGVEPFETPYVPCCTYFLVNDTEGVIVFHPFRDGVKIHPNFPVKYRGKSAYEAIDACVLEMFDRGYDCIYAEIAVELRNVVHAAKHLGFRLLESGDRELFIRRRLDS